MPVVDLETRSFGGLAVLQSDAELIGAVLGGDRKAFAMLIKRYEPSVRAVAMSVLRDGHLAQDAAQEAFVKAYRNLSALRKAAAFGPWLLRIARRSALDLTHQYREVPLPESDLVAEPHLGLLDEEKEQLLGAVLELHESERQAVMLRYFGGYSIKEIAQITGRSSGTITKQLSRAHRRLRVLLKEV
jgi:RNA polymerase sigma-70 factor, ECF subfamily